MQNPKDKLQFLLNYGSEVEWIEYKGNYFDPDEIGKRVSALSNSASLIAKNNGYLVFGIDDDLSVVGTSLNPHEKKVKGEIFDNWLINRLDPKLDYRIHAFEFEGERVVMYEIPAAASRPVKFLKEAYVRVGSVTRSLSEFPDKEGKIWRKVGGVSYESEFAGVNLSVDEVLKMVDYPEYFERVNQPLPDAREQILEKLVEEKIIVAKESLFNLTNLGAILFARNLNDFDTVSRKAVRVIQYAGNDRTEAAREKLFNKGYALSFEEIIDYINDLLPSNEAMGKALRREIKMYPDIAIRELVANSIIHQDFYEPGSSPLIELFVDRIEISNPGAPLIEVLRFIDHVPKSRNESLASLMRRLGVCEERGSGFDKVVKNVEIYQLPAPDIVVSDSFTRVTLYAHKELSAMDVKDKVRACYQHCSLKYVSSKFMTNQTLRGRFDISSKNSSIASRVIGEALDAKLIKNYDPISKSKKYAKYVPFWA